MSAVNVGAMTKANYDAYYKTLPMGRSRITARDARAAAHPAEAAAATAVGAAASAERKRIEHAERNARVHASAAKVIANRNERRGNTSRNTAEYARRRALAQQRQLNNSGNFTITALKGSNSGFNGANEIIRAGVSAAQNPNIRKNRKSRKIHRNRQ